MSSEAPANFVSATIISAQSKDPENVSLVMPSQGVLTRALFAHASGLEDSPFWQFLDAAPDDSHSSNGTDNSRHKSSQGQGKGKTPYGSMAGDNSPGSFDYAPITLGRDQFVWRFA
jgi:hypothetical protein